MTDPQRWHFIAIGGHGMSVLAELAHDLGFQVTGSDRSEGEETRRLRERGIQVDIGHAAHQVRGADVVVISTAIGSDNVEVQQAEADGIEIIHRSVAMARLTDGRDFYAVAGTHGKTTTSAMLAVALEGAGTDPGAAIGGTVSAWRAGSRNGTGPFVAEADESDGSFLNYRPAVAIVTNVEEDHLAHFRGLEHILDTFVEFADRITPDGVLIAGADDAGSREVARRAHANGIRVRSFGAAEEFTPPWSEHVGISQVRLEPASSSARLTLFRDGVAVVNPVDIHITEPGWHTILDAAAAWAAALEATGLSDDGANLAANALSAFTGAGRRFELVGEAAGVRVIDDYAHNPRKVASALAAGRLAAGDGRLLVLFQPALVTRTRDFAEGFAAALDEADAVIVSDIFADREQPIPGVDSGLILAAEPDERAERGAAPFEWVPDMTEAAARVAELAMEGDLIMTVGSGSITTMAPVIVKELQRGSERV